MACAMMRRSRGSAWWSGRAASHFSWGHQGSFRRLIHRLPFFERRNAQFADSSAENGRTGSLCGGQSIADDELQRGFLWPRDLDLFAAVDGGGEIGEVLGGVLEGDLHGLRVAEGRVWVNGMFWRRRNPHFRIEMWGIRPANIE
jgi:hypothetical protein